MTRRTPPKPIIEKTETAALFVVRCPLCGAPVDLQATVESFGTPQGWDFYGRPGERWIKCRGESGPHPYIHFITQLDRGYSNRIAWIEPAKEPAPTQGELL